MVCGRNRMKAAGVIFLIIGISLFGSLQYADAGIDIDGTEGYHGINGYYLAASEYYRIPEREIVVIREMRIRDEEIPVVLFIARKARVPYAGVLDLRARGMSWIGITRHYRLNPEIYHIPVKGLPYGKAYGYYRKEWREDRLLDEDIVNLVNLLFISNRYGYAPERIMRMRSSGRNFVVIHDEVSSGKWKKDRKHDGDRGYSHGYAGNHDNRKSHVGRGLRYSD
jgi:hypothetical protein